MIRPALLASLLASSPAIARTAVPDCPAPGPVTLSTAAPSGAATAAIGVGGLASATLALDAPVLAKLAPIATMTYPAAAQHATGNGGLFAFSIPAGGTYRVAIGAAAWVDVIADGTPVMSSAHGHGPACGGERKHVDFVLAPGRYILQVSGSDAPALALIVGRLPG